MLAKAVRIHGELDLRLEEFELPEIKEDQLLIKVICDSVCMSTYKTALQGEKHLRVPNDIKTNPTIVGHEFAAEIVQIGSKWKGLYKEHDKVIATPPLTYLDFLNGKATIGYSFKYLGGDSTYCIVDGHIIEHGFLIKLNSDAFFKGALIEPASCVIRGFKETFHTDSDGNHYLGLKENGNVLILAGCGPMGLEAIDIALSGFRKIKQLVVTDIDKNRLNRAKEIFESKALKNNIDLIFTDKSDSESLLKLSNNGGYDDVFIYAPIPALIELGDSLLKFDGCLNFFAGPLDKTLSAKVNFYNVHYQKHHFSGSSGSTPEDMKDIAELIGNNCIDPAIMVTHIGGIDSVIETTLNLPKIPGGKKLIYTHINLPLTAIDDFSTLAEKDTRFKELNNLVKKNNGIWSVEAEKYLIENFK